MHKLCDGLLCRKKRRQLWMHETIPQQQFIHQLREIFLYQHQPFAQQSSFTACMHRAFQSCSIVRE